MLVPFCSAAGEPETAPGDLRDGWRGGGDQPDQRVPQRRSSAEARGQKHVGHGEIPVLGQL